MTLEFIDIIPILMVFFFYFMGMPIVYALFGSTFFYFLFTGVLEFFGVDFGRGVAYPYFFFNFRSPVGLFGVSPTGPYPFYLGAFYWLILFMLIVLGFGFLYAKKTTRHAPKKA